MKLFRRLTDFGCFVRGRRQALLMAAIALALFSVSAMRAAI
jgi:hypothetical protein